MSPIGPRELDEKLTQEDAALVAKLTQEIDDSLISGYRGDPVTVVYIRPYPNPRVEHELRRLYTEAGWAKVEFDDNQRDGSSIKLTKPPPPPREWVSAWSEKD